MRDFRLLISASYSCYGLLWNLTNSWTLAHCDIFCHKLLYKQKCICKQVTNLTNILATEYIELFACRAVIGNIITCMLISMVKNIPGVYHITVMVAYVALLSSLITLDSS